MSSAAWPCYYRWNGDAMEPLPRYRHRAVDQFVIGETYRLMVEEERSPQTHRHFFVCVQEAWKNLPEDLAGRFATAEHLRKWALIKCGFHDERTLVMETPADARRTAAFISKMDDQGVILVEGNIVRHFTAKSQSVRAMDKRTFQKSKEAVLELVADMIGVTAKELTAEVKKQGFHDDPEPDAAEPAQEMTREPTPELGADKAIEATANPEPIADSPKPATVPAPKKERTSKPSKPAATPPKADPPRATTLQKATTSKEAIKAIADRAEAASKAKRGTVSCAKCGTVYAVEPDRCEACGSAKFTTEAAPPPAANTDLRNPADYIAYARAWIDATESHDRGMVRWDEESELRNQLKVPIRERTQLQSRLDAKFGV